MKLALTILLSAAVTVGATRVPKAPTVVVVHAHDFSFDAPKTLKPGATTFRLVNDGKELHHLSVIKLAKGKTARDFRESMKVAGPPPNWITGVGGPNAVTPGSMGEATLSLEPGEYVIICFIPSPGESAPHASKGMVSSFTVSEGTDLAPMPKGDVTVTLTDYKFGFSKPLTAGKHLINVENVANQAHELVMVKLNPGKKAIDFDSFIEKDLMKSVPPGVPVGGIGFLDKGRTAAFPADLKPGTYAMLCFAPDAKDGKTHTQHGMMMQFDVK
ncbi:MAG: hypothetical protein ABI664_20145 [bacterium]